MNRRVLGVLALTAAAVSVPLAQEPGREPAPPPMAIPKDDARIEKLKALMGRVELSVDLQQSRRRSR